MSFKPIKAKWPSVVIDNKELNMERKYLATAGTLKFKLNQIKSIQALSYTQLIKAIKNTNRYSNELIFIPQEDILKCKIIGGRPR